MKTLKTIIFALTLLLFTTAHNTFSASLPDLIAKAPGGFPSSVERGDSFSITDSVKNIGLKSAKDFQNFYYLSIDKKKSIDDVLLTGTRTILTLKPSRSSFDTINLTIPDTTPSGRYFIIACADAAKKIRELNERNNCKASKATFMVTEMIPVNVSSAIKDIQVIANQYSEITISYDISQSISNADTVSVDLQNLFNSSSVNIAALSTNNIMKFLALLTSTAEASTQTQVYARFGAANDPNICQNGLQYGPFTVTSILPSQPLTVQPPTVSAQPSSVSIINSGTLAICFQFFSPVDATVNVGNIDFEVAACNQPPSNINGKWTGTYTCRNVGYKDEINQPIRLTITQNGYSAHYVDDGGAKYEGTVCGNVFKFNGGKPGLYKESGKFVLNSDGTGTKTSTWYAASGPNWGTCKDQLHRK